MDTQSLPETPRISSTILVSSPEDVADVLQDASRDGSPVIPIGGGTTLHTGNVVAEDYIAIDTRGLTGVREYHPTDLTASFWAGTTLADVRAVLAENGQELPVDMADVDSATIGGMVATGFSGPRRLGSGTLKDLIIGAGYVRGDGLVAKAGGMLVKNVSGYEIPRFLHGSWGSLAIITSVNLKVIPEPKADMTFVHHEPTLGTSLAGQLSVLQHHPGIQAAVSEKRDSGWVLSVRLMGRQASIEAQVQAFRDELGSQTEVRLGEKDWNDFNARWARNDRGVRLVIGGRAEVLHRLALELESMDGLLGLSVSLGTGTARVLIHPVSMTHAELQDRLSALPVTWVIETAPAGWRAGARVWGPDRDDRALAQSIKDQFDPANILNRGRLFI